MNQSNLATYSFKPLYIETLVRSCGSSMYFIRIHML